MAGRNVAKVIIVCAGHQRFSKCNDDDDHQHYHYHEMSGQPRFRKKSHESLFFSQLISAISSSSLLPFFFLNKKLGRGRWGCQVNSLSISQSGLRGSQAGNSGYSDRGLELYRNTKIEQRRMRVLDIPEQ